MENAIIIFIKNPQLGKVKTRLAETLGNQKALAIYLKLIDHTRQVSLKINAERHLYYSKFIDQTDLWTEDKFIKHLQHSSNDLGQKMYSAFTDLQQLGKKKAVIIGSDCLEMESKIIDAAFHFLENNAAILGPAKDGGYYSIGFNFEKFNSRTDEILKKVFLGKKWSHESVSSEAKAEFADLSLSYALLPMLSDVDVEGDLVKSLI